MSQEHRAESTEHHELSPAELEAARAERLDDLRSNPENTPDNAHERAQEAREVINKVEPKPEEPAAVESTPREPVLPFLNHKLNYVQTLASVQRRLNPVSRSFSRVIHAPAIEKASEVLEETIARPSITVGATWTALILGSIFYFTARHYGFALSGSEITLSFVVGAVLGLVLEGFWRALRRRSRP
jgi:hypothetical protein